VCGGCGWKAGGEKFRSSNLAGLRLRFRPLMKIAILTTDNREPYREYDKPNPWFGTAPEALLQGFAQLPEVEVHVVSCTQRPMVSSPQKLADNIWFHSLHVPNFGWMRTLYQGCVRATRKKLLEIQPDLVHGQGTEREASLGAIFSGLPNVLTIHGNMRLVAKVTQARPFSFWWNAARLETFTLPRSRGVVCITNYTRDAVAGLAKKTWVVPNAVDASFFDVQSAPDPAKTPVVLCVGGICVRKNQNAFIRALDPLASKRKFRLVFLGDMTRDNPYGREFLELLRTRAWCEHGGFVDREKLKEWLRGSTLLALPSLEDNCPMTVLEAAAAGVPVVAANVGGVPDLVADGKTGLLCDPLNATSMSGAVEKILTQPELARALVAEASRSALARFHPEVIARRHLEIYREVLGARS
jgi:glycosyltransferase involved in cell wall biosynthesis